MPAPPEEILDHILIKPDQLQQRVRELGRQISRDYAEHSQIMLIGILKGCLLFMVDLMRHISIPNRIDFMDVTSYGAGARESTGTVRILMDLHGSIEGEHVLIVEDIIDSGHTLSQVLKLLEARQPASLKVCTLLDKSERREVNIPLDYVGFTIPDAFVFGYGLDIDEYYRNLPYIGVVRSDIDLSAG